MFLQNPLIAELYIYAFPQDTLKWGFSQQAQPWSKQTVDDFAELYIYAFPQDTLKWGFSQQAQPWSKQTVDDYEVKSTVLCL